MEKLTSPSVITDISRKFDFKFSKVLGQNFLIDQNILNKIIQSSGITRHDYVLEIGPGIGTLTQAIAQKAKKVVVVEIDKSLLPVLNYTLADYHNVCIINDDILKADLQDIIKHQFDSHSFKVVANLPYYITTPIIMRLLEEGYDIESMTVMMQKEVADRLKANPGSKDYGTISVAVQSYAQVDIAFTVPPDVFMPKPKVGSALVKLEVLDKPLVEKDNRQAFFKTVKAAFSQRRKTLINSLHRSGIFDINKDEMTQVLTRSGIDPYARAETLGIEEFKRIAYQLERYIIHL
ncbi:MAG: 16S rRNA (adenine(1518)-N(6)/adenine(1519)-N(6))-dimethyltransferase RsmA [Clostridia bacterium]|nr:16S rRNA (adenine(1518)-N(6)/adenine(1519)-N(6))-dimethyltransferase RsmA [Clostridia bacterium]